MDVLYTFIGILLFSGLLNGIFFWNGFVQANRKAWEAFIPIYGQIIFLKIIERPWWWVLLLILPVIGNIMAIVMLYEWLHVFGYRKKRHTAFAVLSLGIFILYIHYVAKPQYVGKDNETIRK